MSSGDIFITLVVGLVFGIVSFIKGLSWFRQKQMIENIPTSKIRSLAMGLAEITGKAVVYDLPMLSPMSGDECIYYRFIVEEFKPGKMEINHTISMRENPSDMFRYSARGGKWVVLARGEKRTNFYLKDATGRVLVDPTSARIDVKPNFEFTSGLGKDPPRNVVRFLEKEHINHEGLLGLNKRMRFREYVIRPNDTLYILGTAGDNPFVAEGTAKENAEDIMMHRGENEKFFMISDRSERELLGSLKWKVYGGVFGGIALIAGCLAAIFLYAGVL